MRGIAKFAIVMLLGLVITNGVFGKEKTNTISSPLVKIKITSPKVAKAGTEITGTYTNSKLSGIELFVQYGGNIEKVKAESGKWSITIKYVSKAKDDILFFSKVNNVENIGDGTFAHLTLVQVKGEISAKIIGGGRIFQIWTGDQDIDGVLTGSPSTSSFGLTTFSFSPNILLDEAGLKVIGGTNKLSFRRSFNGLRRFNGVTITITSIFSGCKFIASKKVKQGLFGDALILK